VDEVVDACACAIVDVGACVGAGAGVGMVAGTVATVDVDVVTRWPTGFDLLASSDDIAPVLR
jgi:hypothetical protein